MRLLEIVLLLATIVIPFLLSSKKQYLNNKLLLGLITGVLILHLLFEGWRWQMITIYLISSIILLCLIKGYTFFKGKRFRKIASGIFLFLFLLIGVALSHIFPVFHLPAPTGEYSVGSQYFYVNTNNKETITENPDDTRELMVKVWYPAKINDEQKEKYLDKGERLGFTAKYGLPSFMLNYLNNVSTNTYIKPTISEGTFPVLIFSHGYHSNATGYYALIEEIVSQGFIVLNINHTYESMGSQFPDGKIKLYNWKYNAKKNTKEMAQLAWDSMRILRESNDEKEKRKVVENSLRKYLAAEITDRWAKDIDYIIAQIPKWEISTFLSGHIDANSIGVFGHSQGGAAAGQALVDNPVIKAGINLDGTQWGKMVDTLFTKPFLLLSADWPEEHPNLNKYAYQNGSQSDMYKVKLKNSGHSNFMDIPYMVNLSMINEAGSIEHSRAIEITSKVVVAFFQTYLSNKPQDFDQLQKHYPDLEIKKTH